MFQRLVSYGQGLASHQAGPDLDTAPVQSRADFDWNDAALPTTDESPNTIAPRRAPLSPYLAPGNGSHYWVAQHIVLHVSHFWFNARLALRRIHNRQQLQRKLQQHLSSVAAVPTQAAAEAAAPKLLMMYLGLL